MSLTSVSQVRSHLYRLNLGEGAIRNQAVRLSALQYSSLPHGRIVADSDRVKAVASDIPTSEQITLGAEPQHFSQSNPVPATVVCAADDSLSTIYQENLDFSVDYVAGTISRINGGSIVSGSTITAWYLYYRSYRRDIDYSIDYERGRLRRNNDGGIEDGQELLVDYSVGDAEFSDTEIAQCIEEAEAEIEHLVDPDRITLSDPAIMAAATFLTLSLLCRDSAAISAAGTSGTGTTSTLWITLSQSYRETALRLLMWFRRALPSLKPPQLA
jgi:hypothetical protein